MENNVSFWPAKRGQWLRYVLLKHEKDGRVEHFDLLLETGRDHPGGKTLWALELAELPMGKNSFQATLHGMHGARYLHFEGDIGGGRGQVTRLDSGTYRASTIGGAMFISLRDGLLAGEYVVVRTGHGLHRWTRHEIA